MKSLNEFLNEGKNDKEVLFIFDTTDKLGNKKELTVNAYKDLEGDLDYHWVGKGKGNGTGSSLPNGILLPEGITEFDTVESIKKDIINAFKKVGIKAVVKYDNPKKLKFVFESEFTHNEKYWDKKFKVALKRMPEWADEKVDLVNSIRRAYNELEIDVLDSDPKAIKMLDWRKHYRDVKKFQDYAKDIWAKLKGNEWAKQNALEDYLDWLK